MGDNPATENLLSPKELAAHSGWTERRIRSLISSKQLRHIRVGAIILSPKDSVDEYIRNHMVEPNINFLNTLPKDFLEPRQEEPLKIKNNNVEQARKAANNMIK